MRYEDFVNVYENVLADYWNRTGSLLLAWKQSYEWPRGVTLSEAAARRDRLEARLKEDLESYGWITKQTFDAVIKWGFGRSSDNSAEDVRTVTKEAFDYLRNKQIADAARAMTKLPGVGISRASKVLALSNQAEYGIYDSRAAHGLSDLVYGDRRLIPIPPGRVITGDPRAKTDFCQAFEEYLWVLTFLRNRAQSHPELREHFTRVADLEMALFAHSRAQIVSLPNYQSPPHLKGNVELDEGDCYWTLGHGARAKRFWADISERGVTTWSGAEGHTRISLNAEDIERCLNHFRQADWFPLGNTIDNVKPNSFGEYFQKVLGVSPKFASHFAAVLVNQHRLAYRYGQHNAIELKVTDQR